MKLRTVAKCLLPAWAWNTLRALRRRLKWGVARTRGIAIDREEILAGLVRIGVRQGDILLVHSSLTSLGHVVGGPDAVIDALLGAVGPAGTLLMPAYPVVGDWMAYLQSDPLFDPQTSPSGFGKITDSFWRRPGVLRSLHPTHSVAAWGAEAEYLLRDHHLSPTPAGPTSPFRRLAELHGRILHLGSPFWSTSSFHIVEDVVHPFPRQVYLSEPVPLRYLDHQRCEQVMAVMVHDPALVPRRIDKVPWKELEIYNHCRDQGVVSTSRIGRATTHLIEAGPLEVLLEKLAGEGITIYV